MGRLEALPDRNGGARKKVPTAEQIKVLRAGWHRKRQDQVADLLGVHPNTARRWYREYVEGGKEG